MPNAFLSRRHEPGRFRPREPGRILESIEDPVRRAKPLDHSSVGNELRIAHGQKLLKTKSVSTKYWVDRSIGTYQEVGKFLAPLAHVVRVRIDVTRESIEAMIEGLEGAGVRPGRSRSRGRSHWNSSG